MLKKFIFCFISLIVFLSFSNSLVFAEETTNEKLIYLTFDDGLSPHMTDTFIEILNEEGVKATFFVIGNTLEDNQLTLKKLVDSGHALGLHTYSHKGDLIYKSRSAFLDEMLKTQSIIKDLTGLTVNIIRFPFGSINHYFKLNQEWIDMLHDNNMKIYDWNVDTHDGDHYGNSPYNIFKATVDTKDTIILLMHCTELNKNSASALKETIKYYKEHGYTFKVIDDSTPEMYSFKNKK